MTSDQMMEFAKSVAAGGKASKSDVMDFMKSLLAEAGPIQTDDPPAKAPESEPAKSPYVTVASNGAVHVQVARFFTKNEALEFGRAVVAAAQS